MKKISKKQNIINQLNGEEGAAIRKIGNNFCTNYTETCKNEQGQCHNYYEIDNKTGNINVCRTGNPCKSKAYNLSNKVRNRGTIMNKVCTKYVKEDLTNSGDVLRRNSSNSKKKISRSIISKKSSTRSNKYTKFSKKVNTRSTSGGKKYCKTRRKKKTYKKVNKN